MKDQFQNQKEATMIKCRLDRTTILILRCLPNNRLKLTMIADSNKTIITRTISEMLTKIFKQINMEMKELKIRVGGILTANR